MLVRRTLFAFLVTFACALAVFTLPRFVSNTILGATPQSQSRDTVAAATTAQAPAAPPVVVAAPRSLAARLRGVFGMIALLAIVFGSALFAVMYYLGVMQLVVKAFAIVMNKVMGASGAESLNVAASIFMGQTEAPLTIRPFLPRMTRSELMTVMTAGMAHVSGSIMAAYIAFGIEARHLLTAVIMTAPGTIMMAKIIEP